ncbi:MAG: type I 3-dehydroquinate dehydratase [Bacteroidales bacterium]|nr:type I 3-dehydroquinate dehydratase [Bacteroidales bacterium]
MICTTIQNRNLKEISQLLSSGDIMMAEIRLDRCDLSLDEISELFSGTDVPLVATCRFVECRDAEQRLLAAITAGAAYADLELEAPASVGRKIRKACSSEGTQLIRSYHNFEAVPSREELLEIAGRCVRFGADIVKIAVMPSSAEDAGRVPGLYCDFRDRPLVAFAMGVAGKHTRISCLALGAPFTYAALTQEEAAAPGQWPYREMTEAVYGSRKFLRCLGPLRMNASKSFAQRAIILAALAEGESRLGGYTSCGDNASALAAVSALGAKIRTEIEDGLETLVIQGVDADTGSIGITELHVGESGFLTRMMIPVMAATARDPVRVTGEKTLLKRPLAGAHDIMASFGVALRPLSDLPAPERKTDCLVPLEVHGPLIPGKADIDGRGGSQLISGLLTALPLCGAPSLVHVNEPRSIPYMFITLDVMREFGVKVQSEMEGDDLFLDEGDWSHCTGITFRIPAPCRYKGTSMMLEGDWSGAANFLVAGAIFGEALVEGLDTKSLQADFSIVDILTSAGACMSCMEPGEGLPRGGVHSQMAPLTAFDADATNCPDLFPIVAVLAAFSEGESHITGAGRLVHKETNRAAAILETLDRMGVEAFLEGDVMTIRGESLARRTLTGNLLKGGSFRSWGDHRMVMAISVASLGADSPVEIDDTACVSKSFPEFNELFAELIR